MLFLTTMVPKAANISFFRRSHGKLLACIRHMVFSLLKMKMLYYKKKIQVGILDNYVTSARNSLQHSANPEYCRLPEDLSTFTLVNAC